MADGPQITPDPYVDPENVELLEQLGSILHGQQLSDVSLANQREAVNKAQTPVPPHPNVQISQIEVNTTHGKVKTFVFRPKDQPSDIPFFYHAHGGGWILANVFDFTAFLSDLVNRTGFAAVFPQYTLAPERQFPAQQEQCLEVLQYFIRYGQTMHLLVDKVVLSGDSAGGQLTTAVNILNHQRALNLPIAHQILISPVVDVTSLISTFSQWKFQNGPFLTTAFLRESITDYIPDIKDRHSILASSILMTKNQVKQYMPPTTILSSQADWLRDQGQNFAKLLQQSSVPCGVLQSVASLHDYIIFNKSRTSPTADLVMTVIAGKLKEVLGTQESGKSALLGGGGRDVKSSSRHIALLASTRVAGAPSHQSNGNHTVIEV